MPNARRSPRPADWQELRLRDCIQPGVRVLFVGINPGVRSAVTGHHFAGFSNRFWKLLWEAKLPYAGNATPITYMAGGRQFVLIQADNARDKKAAQGAAYVAFALPAGG